MHTLTNCNVWLAARSFYDPKGLGYLTTPYIESAMQRNACRLVLWWFCDGSVMVKFVALRPRLPNRIGWFYVKVLAVSRSIAERSGRLNARIHSLPVNRERERRENCMNSAIRNLLFNFLRKAYSTFYFYSGDCHRPCFPLLFFYTYHSQQVARTKASPELRTLLGRCDPSHANHCSTTS